VRDYLLDVVLERVHDGGVRVKLLNLLVPRVARLGEVEACPAEESVLPAVVIVLPVM
jgi:hypothetical protein